MLAIISLVLSCCVTAFSLRSPHMTKRLHLHQPESISKDLLSLCTEHWASRTLDHFNWEPPACAPTFQQRNYVCGKEHWRPFLDSSGPIFFYAGNEADVLLYLNNSGLLWEAAPAFGALVVYAEHRYYGQSRPSCPDSLPKNRKMQYLTTEQAMADYVELIWELKHELNAVDAPVIAFGGSYGGMLAAWMRMKYPATIDGSIAASAPIWNFEGEDPPFDPLAFSKGVTYDATAEGGSAPACVPNARAGFQLMETLGATEEGRTLLKSAMRLCPDADMFSLDNATSFRDWIAGAWDSMAMGNYPYESGYILNGRGVLPPFPVRVACGYLSKPGLEGRELLAGMANAAGVFYNYTGSLKCFDYNEGANEETDEVEDYWGYQYCTEMTMPFARGVNDMFYSEPWDLDATIAACQDEWGVTPRPLWATHEWGGKKIGAASRIAFSNGLYDPWHGGGVLEDVSRDLPATIIPEGAHHLDLMFSRPDDDEGVKTARSKELQLIAAWIAEARAEQGALRKDSTGGPHEQRSHSDSDAAAHPGFQLNLGHDDARHQIKVPRKLAPQ